MLVKFSVILKPTVLTAYCTMEQIRPQKKLKKNADVDSARIYPVLPHHGQQKHNTNTANFLSL